MRNYEMVLQLCVEHKIIVLLVSTINSKYWVWNEAHSDT
jgi:hypothetical protein